MKKTIQLSAAQRAQLTEESIGITRIDDSLLGMVAGGAGGSGDWGIHPGAPGSDTTMSESCMPYTNSTHTAWDACP